MSTLESRTSAVAFGTSTRVHVAINVSDIQKSLPFYTVLFGQEPTKVREDYAKFEVAEPPINFTLNFHSDFKRGGGSLSHFGIQVKSTEEVLLSKERFEREGLATFEEDNVTCCYALQDKVWVTDPDGNGWEVFVVLEADAPSHSLNQNATASCACSSTPDFSGKESKTIELLNKVSAQSCC